MSKPSAALLRLLRDLMKKRGLNTAATAQAAGLDRHRLRKVLSGAEPMLVDELLALGQALELSPEELGLSIPDEVDEVDDAPQAVPTLEAFDREQDDDDLGIDPFGNQPQQLFKVGFALGCDFLFVVGTSELEDSGVPKQVLRQFGDRDLPIRLDAAYHGYNDPRYTDEGITLTLSFDAVYECHFPWSAIRQVLFFPVAPEPLDRDDGTDEQGDEPGPPTLRLVT